MVGDEASGVSHQQGRTWKEPLPRVLSDGSSQPMRRNPQTEKTVAPRVQPSSQLLTVFSPFATGPLATELLAGLTVMMFGRGETGEGR